MMSPSIRNFFNALNNTDIDRQRLVLLSDSLKTCADQRVDLRKLSIDQFSIEKIVILKNALADCPSLEYIDSVPNLSHLNAKAFTEFAQIFATCKSLRGLNLFATYLSIGRTRTNQNFSLQERFEILGNALANCPQLETIGLSGNNLLEDEDTLKTLLAFLRRIPKLHEVDLSLNARHLDANRSRLLGEGLSACKNLRKIFLRDNRFETLKDTEFQEFCDLLSYCDSLTEIVFDHKLSAKKKSAIEEMCQQHQTKIDLIADAQPTDVDQSASLPEMLLLPAVVAQESEQSIKGLEADANPITVAAESDPKPPILPMATAARRLLQEQRRLEDVGNHTKETTNTWSCTIL